MMEQGFDYEQEIKMEKIFSKDGNTLLHIIHRISDFDSRNELVSPDQTLQVASLELIGENTFRAHRHITKEIHSDETIAQESWVIISGEVKVDYYDLDDSFIKSLILSTGDCSITLQGGHGYSSTTDVLVYEFKTGPYLGQILDKVFIDAHDSVGG